MTKLLLEPKSNISLIEKCDGIILGLKGYSIGYEIEMTIEQIKSFVEQYPKKDIFVVINKNIMNEELSSVEAILKELETVNIEGILFYDLSVLFIKQKNNLKINLVWNQTHMVTNYNTCNYYNSEGCKYAYLSSEITLDEMLEIINKSQIRTLVKVFGHPVMAHSKRKLLTNYFKHIRKKKNSNTYTIRETHLGKEYIINEDNNGTTVFEGKLVNGIKPSFDLNGKVDYFIIEEQANYIDETIDVFNKVINNKIEVGEATKVLDTYYSNATEGFFYTKTIYKVKDDETN